MNTRAYAYAVVFSKNISPECKDTQVRYGTFISCSGIKKEEANKAILSAPNVYPLIQQGYAMQSFDFMLIDPDIAPMNKENNEKRFPN